MTELHVDRSPFHRLIGLELVRADDGVVEMRLPWRDELGRTALHVAAELGDEALVALLLRHGADPHACDVHGKTAVYLAVSAGHSEAVEMFLECGGSSSGGGCGGGTGSSSDVDGCGGGRISPGSAGCDSSVALSRVELFNY